MDLSGYRKRLVDRYLPITESGVTLYPITVDDIESYISARPALEFMQQLLPVELLRLPLLSALYQLELTIQIQQEDKDLKFDLFTKTVLLLALALRLGRGLTENERIAMCRVEFNPNNPLDLVALRFRNGKEGEIVITPTMYDALRPIIAAQNGAEIQPLDANPQLILAERQILASKNTDIKYDLANKIAWVAAKSGRDDEEVFTWPILKFERRAKVLQLELNYLIYGIAQNSGFVKFENGNPCPSPYFEREFDALPAKMLSSVGNGAALKAVQTAEDNQPTIKGV